MHYLNTTRLLRTAPTDETLTQLLTMLDRDIAPSAGTLPGLRTISWLLSHDRMTLQAFSGWDGPDDPLRGERSEQHTKNGVRINELLGGLAAPQSHSYYQLLAERRFG